MLPVGYAYIRYSTMAQAVGDSVDRQTNPLKAFTKATGVEVKEIIIDEGVSSYRGNNVNKGKFKEILDRIDKKIIRSGDYIVVESIDRITRQRVLDGVELLQSILKKGIKIYTTSDSRCYSYDDPSKDLETLMMIALIAKRANEESETKSFRRKSAWVDAKSLAISGVAKINKSNAPYGLVYDHAEKKFVINETEADEIRKIFELLKYMGVSNAIREVNLNSKRKWANRHVAHMIKSQYPLGVLRSQKRTVNGKKNFWNI
ncbi:recombinase family protein [Pseudomonas peli]|uniref:recombinase family protein n=1 Tax=Pseudomonas peli TaxID=592361 RepID=UPI0024AD03DF|nr:recombinase family protein [Pseudomonas peli]